MTIFGKHTLLLSITFFLVVPHPKLACSDFVPFIGEKGETLIGLGDISDFKISPDGRYFATSSTYGVVIWDATTIDPIQMIQVNNLEEPLSDIEFSADSRQIFTPSSSHDVTLWDIETGTAVHEFKAHTSQVVTLDVSPDGKRLLTGGLDNWVFLLDVESGQRLFSFWEHFLTVESVELSADGTKFFSFDPKNMYVREVETGTQLEFWGLNLKGDRFQWSPGEQFLLLSLNSHVELWESRSPKLAASWDIEDKQVRDLAFSSDGKWGIVTHAQGADIVSTETFAVQKKIPLGISQLEKHPSGELYGIGSDASDYGMHWIGRVNWVNANVEVIQKEIFLEHTTPAIAVYHNVLRNEILTAESGGIVKRWNAPTGELLHSLRLPTKIRQADFSATDRFLLTVGPPNVQSATHSAIHLWNVDTQTLMSSGEPDPNIPIKKAFLLANTPTVVYLLENDRFNSWDIRSMDDFPRFDIPAAEPVEDLFVTENHEYFLLKMKNGSLLTYQIGRKEPLYQNNLPPGFDVESISNDAAFVMTFNTNDPLEHKLLDTKADLIQDMPERLNFSAFSPDNRFLMTWGDGLKLWNPIITNRPFRLTRYSWQMGPIQFSSDNRQLFIRKNPLHIFDISEYTSVVSWFTY